MTDKQKLAENARKIIELKGMCYGVRCQQCVCDSENGCIINDTTSAHFESPMAVEICEQWLKDNQED